jgi:hypothetical protein
MTMLFAAVHESGYGTKRTWRDVRLESVIRSKADMDWILADHTQMRVRS